MPHGRNTSKGLFEGLHEYYEAYFDYGNDNDIRIRHVGRLISGLFILKDNCTVGFLLLITF